MNGMVKGLVAVALVVLVLVVMGVMMFFSISNSEIGLRNQIVAQQDACKVVFDNTWKIIAQKAQVADKYKDGFKDIYPALMEGRYGNEKGGALMKFVTESNPQFDVAIYRDLSSAIEAQRTVFTREQKTLIDLKREHDNIRQKFPSSVVVGGRPEIKIELITSGKTQETYVNGQENDIKL